MKDSLRLTVVFTPSIGVYVSQNGYFAVSEENAERLNVLLAE